MKKYIIEIEAGKIFSYLADNYRLMKPHGDEFYSGKNFSDYWEWFLEEISADESAVCFISEADAQKDLDRLKNAAPKIFHVVDSIWQMSELKKFFTEYRHEPIKENFHWDEVERQIIFDGGKSFKLDGLANFILHEDKLSSKFKVKFEPTAGKLKIKVYTPPVNQETPSEKIFDSKEPPAGNFKIKVYTPPAKQETPPEKISEQSAPPNEALEKISASDFRKYIEEQTDGQCDRISFKE